MKTYARLLLLLAALLTLSHPQAALAQFVVGGTNGTLTAQDNLIPIGDRALITDALPDSARGRTRDVWLYWKSTHYVPRSAPPTTRTNGEPRADICAADFGGDDEWDNRTQGWTDQTLFRVESDRVFPNKIYRFLVCIDREPTPTESAAFLKRVARSTATVLRRQSIPATDSTGRMLSEDERIARAVPLISDTVTALLETLEAQSERSAVATERLSFEHWPVPDGDSLTAAYQQLARGAIRLSDSAHASALTFERDRGRAFRSLAALHRHPALRAALHASFVLGDDRHHVVANAALMEARRPIALLAGLEATPTAVRPASSADSMDTYRALATGTLRLDRSTAARSVSQRLSVCTPPSKSTATVLCIRQLAHTHRDTLKAMLENVRATSTELVRLDTLLARPEIRNALLSESHLGTHVVTQTQIDGLHQAVRHARADLASMDALLGRLHTATSAARKAHADAFAAIQRVHKDSARLISGKHYHARTEPQQY
ncbi:MAG: hypothetical protein AAFN13_15140, partial [Bacteroidota bacterium]